MEYLKKHKYLLLSFVLIVFVSGVVLSGFLPFFPSLSNYFWPYPPSFLNFFILVILNAFGIFFALRSKKLKESLYPAAIIATMGMLTLAIVVVLYAYTSFVWSFCGNGPC